MRCVLSQGMGELAASCGWQHTPHTAAPASATPPLALNQVVQALGTTTPNSAASFMHSRFWAAAVRNRAEEQVEPCSWFITRKAPSLRREGVSAGRDGGHQGVEIVLGWIAGLEKRQAGTRQ